jgi:integrase
MAAIKRRKRSDGTVAFRVVWRTGGTRDGDWQSETLYTARDAEHFRADVEAAGEQWPDGWVKGVGYLPRLANRDRPPTPFKDFATAYVEELTGIEAETRHRYLGQISWMDVWLTDVMGEPPTVEGLTDSHIKRFVNTREAKGASPKTIANYHGLLFAIMAAAVRQGLRTTNPCADTRLPRRDAGDVDEEPQVFLTEEEFALIAEAMFPSQVRHPEARRRMRMERQDGIAGTAEDRDLIEVAVGTGLRWGELTALQVRDLDLDAPVPRLSVRRAWKRNKLKPDGTYMLPDQPPHYLGKPKSKKSRRRITLAPSVVAVLRGRIAGKTPADLVFTAPRGGRLNHATWYEDRWQRSVEIARARGLAVRPRFHDLRHTHAAWLISANVPLPVIQQRLGHESIQITVDVYGGLLVQAHAVADAAIEAALSGRRIDVPGASTLVPAADYDVEYSADDDLPDEVPSEARTVV